jgi:benzoate/toluate 1,2-dioxygenase beta subunit
MSFAYDEVRDFLHREARLLDDKDWDNWLAMYARNVQYWLPAWDDDGKLTADPQSEISLMFYQNREGLEDRVFRIRTEKSTASTPAPRTSHNLSNIEILEQDGDRCSVRFNWITLSYRYQAVQQYFGTSTYVLARDAGTLRITDKKVVLKNDYIHQVIDIYHI